MLASPRRWSVPLLSCLVLLLVAVFSGPASAAVDHSTIKINEVRSDGTDTIELVNTGASAVDVSGLVLKDEKDVTPFTIPAGTVIEPHGFVALTGFAFGLGKGDSARLFDGSTLLDSTTWPLDTHANSWGRCPDGTGAFGVTVPTFGAANECAPDPTQVKINEVKTNPNPDFVELVNTGSLPIDISAWTAVDNEPGRVPTAVTTSATTIAPGGYFSFTPTFGLGDADSITIFTGDGTQIDTYSWATHPLPSAVRCPEGAGAFVLSSAATPGARNSCPVPAGAADIKINEIESDPNDKVELVNTGTASVDLSGYVLKDEGNDPFTVPAGTTIGAGAFLVIDPSAVFKFGKGDSARLFAPGGETVLDSTTWPVDTHATTWGRCADGTGAFRMTTPTLGTANDCTVSAPATVITINEVESNGDTVGDWVELTNTGTTAVDASGWKLLDNDVAHAATPVVVPAGTTIAPGGFTAIYTEHDQAPGFGLGNPDSVTLFLPDGTTTVDSYAWDAHATTTYGRCADGTGAFTTTVAPTRGAANSCGTGTDPGTGTLPTTTVWPGSPTVRTSDLSETFLQDLSGLAFDPKDADVLWAAQNKLGTLFKLVRDGQNWVPDAADGWGVGKTPKYLDGNGAPDTEGLTIGPDGFIYAASERDNANNKISRMSILRYAPDTADTTLVPTDEWNLTGQIPVAGANLGLEGVTWIPDSFLTAGGFVDQSTGTVYKPSDYPLHGTGLYVVAVEDTGALHAFALDSTGGTSHRIATIASGFPHLADVTFDPERQRLWAVTDDTHDGKTSLLRIQDGAFVVSEAYDRPATM
ncbi:MAG: lamin tail domain-containing protein, partial [Aeromicrobium sp.]